MTIKTTAAGVARTAANLLGAFLAALALTLPAHANFASDCAGCHDASNQNYFNGAGASNIITYANSNGMGAVFTGGATAATVATEIAAMLPANNPANEPITFQTGKLFVLPNIYHSTAWGGGATSSVSPVSAPSKGSVVYSTSGANYRATYTPAACQTGSDSFSYRASGSGGDTSTRTATVVIGNPTSGPTISTGAALPGGQTATAYSQALTATPCASLVTFTLQSGALPNGLNLSGSGVISGTPTVGGLFNFTVRATYVGGQFTDKAFSINVLAPPDITSSTTAANSSVGIVYSGYTATATNPPNTFSVPPQPNPGSLPPGLTMSAGGVVSGTPTSAAGSPYNVQVTATNADGSDMQVVVFNVVPSIGSASTANGQTGVAFGYQITANPGPGYTSYAALDPLPAGLTLNAGTGLISGIPSALGSTNVRLTGSNAFGTSAQFTLTINITSGPPVITSAATAPNGSVGVAYSGYTITATNSPTSYGATGLPPGLTVNTSTGLISGMPTSAAGSPYTATVTASNGVAPDGSQSVTFNVVPAINSAATASGQTGVAFNYQITAAAGPAFTSYAALDPLPAGLMLNTGTGAITGVPTALGGPTNVRLTGSNAFGTSAQFTLAITITLGPPVISSPLTASGGVTVPFSYQITATNPPHNAFDATPLPPGLSVNTSTGLISGAPNPGAGGTYNITISATNATNTGSATLVLTISENPPVITSPLTANGTTGSPFTYTITAINGTTAFSATGLPAGLTINTTTGVISGTPTTPGTFNVPITATNGSGSDAETLVITLALGPPVITSATTAPNGAVGVAYSGYTITATNSPTTFGASNLPPGLTLNTATGAITGTPTSAAGSPYTATVTASNGVAPNASQSVTFNVVPAIASPPTAAGQTGVPFSYQITSAPGPAFTSYAALDPLPAGLTLNTGTGAITGLPTVVGGPTNVRLTGSNAFGTSAQFTLAITIVFGPPVITSPATAGGSEGFPFSYQITATNSPASFGATGLPAGLAVNTATGLISGTPTVSGTFNVTISATNATATGTSTLTITLGIGIPAITSAPTATGATGVAFIYTVTATNGATSFGASGLPPGLAIDSSNGQIRGTPASAGTFNVNLSATNATGTGTQALTVTISLSPPTVPPGGPVPANQGVPFSYAIPVTGSPTGFTATGLPPGLTLDSGSGIISGTPTASGTYVVTASATNATGTTTFTFTIIVRVAPPTAAGTSVEVPFETATPVALPIVGEQYTIDLVVLPEHGLVSVVPGSNVVTYAPATGFIGLDSFRYTVSNAAGTSAEATVSINVLPLPPTGSTALFTVQLNTTTTFDLKPLIKGSGVTGVSIHTQPLHGSTRVNGLQVTYTPKTDYFGADAFGYIVYGSVGQSSPVTINILVVGRPDPTKDRDVVGLVEAQTQAARRFAGTQIGNIQRRMESLHRTEAVVPAKEEDKPATPPQTGSARPPEPAIAATATIEPIRTAYAAEPVRVASAADATPQPVRDVGPPSLVGALAQAVVSGSLNGSTTPPAANGLSFWISGNAWFGRLDGSDVRTGSEFSTDGITFGVDRRFGERLSAGLAAGFAREDTDIGTAGSRSKARAGSIAGYGSYQVGPRTYIDALLGYGTLDFDSQRHVTALESIASASRKGRQFFGSVAAAYEYRYGNALVSPYGRIDFSADRLDATSESGVGNYALTFAEQDQRNSQAVVGVRAESRHETDFGFVEPRARLEYRRELGNASGVQLWYADLPGEVYSITPSGTSRSSMLLGVGADLLFGGGLKVGLDYLAQRASGASNTQGIRLMVTQELGVGAASPWRFEPLLYRYPINVDFGYSYDDNVNRARDRPNRLEDSIFSMSANVSRAWPIAANMRGQLTALASGEKFQRYNGLGRFAGGAQGELQYRTSGAFDATTLALVGRALYEQYESNYRTGPRYFVGFNARRALTDRIEIFGEVGANWRYGNSEVFNWRDYAAKLNIDYALGRKGILYLTGEYRRGDSVSSGPPSLAVGAADVFVPDDAFEDLGYIAYRIDGTTLLGTIGVNYPLGARDSVDLSWRRVEGKARKSLSFESGPLRYIDNQYSLMYLMRF